MTEAATKATFSERKSLSAAFHEKITGEPNSGCWLWTGASGTRGYGHIRKNGKMLKAHRVAWTLYRGAIPEGLCVLHHCDVTSCVNPGHLFIGTHTDNMRDKERKGRANHASGLRHGRYTKPWRTCRGDAHHARRIPLFFAGERNGRAKLTKADVLAIRVDPLGCLRASRKYGVSKTTIQKIRKRLLWRHI